MRLRDKVIVITGSTKGIGRGIAEELAREGAHVVVSGRNVLEGEKTVDGICQNGGQAYFIPADISSVEDCRRLIEETVRIYSYIDGLVNNAGIFPRASLMEVDEQTYDLVMATNLKGAFFCSQQALIHMLEQKSGSIVNIGSTHWKISSADLPVYGMAKGGLHTLTRHIAHHCAAHGVRANWVTVGWVISPGEILLTKEAGHDMDWLQKQVKKVIPSGQFQTPRDIAYACIYLLSDESLQVTGTDIEVTGGMQDG